MSGLKAVDYAFSQAKAQVTPDEIDAYTVVNTGVLSVSATWFGTAAGGTSTEAKPLVILSKTADHPRNLLYSVVGTADMGGTWVVNGKNQFGEVISETVALGTAAAGTPAAAVAGTKIFAEVTSGTFTVATAGVGLGSARLGVAVGTAATAAFKLGLPTKIGAVADVKSIIWIKEHVPTAINGGSIQSATYVDATNHAIMGSAVMGGTEVYKVTLKSTFDNSGQGANLTNL